MRRIIYHFFILAGLLSMISCARRPANAEPLSEDAPIFPDYKEVTIPVNIAPLNFSLLEKDKGILVAGDKVFRSRRGVFRLSPRKWRKMLSKSGDNGSINLDIFVRRDGKWLSYQPFKIHISQDKIDPWFSYRLIPPGYQGWQDMGIYQRNLESYSEKAILTNDLTGGNCMNCHTYMNGDPSKMVFHARATFGGTMVVNEGE
ncbi:MAG: hypothetical protein J6N54_07260, partial [Bacteroidales bacterium]|nr:hypothetical protein [Bacteroidales bacterium]